MRRGIILCYHRVASDPIDPWRLCVPAAAFAAQLRVLSTHCDVVELEQLTPSALCRRRRPLAAVTFDDGISTTSTLHRIYSSTNSVPRNRLPDPPTLSPANALRGGCPCVRHARPPLGRPAADASVSVRIAVLRGRNAGGPRRGLRAASAATGRRTRPPGRTRRRLERSRRAQLPRMASAADVSAANGACLAFGAHTRSHPVLARLPHAGQEAEIAGSKQVVEELASRRVSAFAYPHGRAGDFTRETAKLVAAAGFSLACTTNAGFVSARSAAYELPRLVVTDDGEDTFERVLVQTLRRLRRR